MYKRREKYSEENIKLYQEYYDSGKNLDEVDEKFGTWRGTLSKYIKLRKLTTLQVKQRASRNRGSYRNRVKTEAVVYKGGKCSICGYNKCQKALDFHHLNPLEKDFNISGGTRSFESIKKELDKCVLVCSNCHTEIHSGLHADIYPRTDTA